MWWERHAAWIKNRNTYSLMVGKPEVKKYTWKTGVEDRIILKWTLKEIGREVVDWNDLTKKRNN